MGRRVITVGELDASGETAIDTIGDHSGTETVEKVATVDTLKDQIVKTIPADIVAVWLVLLNLARIDPDLVTPQIALGGVALFAFVLTPWYIWVSTEEPTPTTKNGKWKRRAQIGLTSLAFPIWAYSLETPFAEMEIYNPVLAASLLALFSLLPVLVYGTIDKTIDN